MIIKGKPYTTSNLHELPDEINVFAATTKEDDSSIAFFGAINPLSNFYEAEFTVEGITYISSEQFIQARKVLYFKDNNTYNLIMGARTLLDCKIHGSKVKNFRKEEWDGKAKELCQPGIHAKFQQNPDLFSTLCEKTSTKTIVESANDRVWGTGTTLGNPECLNCDRWVSQGILGELLEEVRSQQHHQSQQPVCVRPTTTEPNQAMEPIANKMLSIANYPQFRPPLQPPPLPDATLYMSNMPSVTWPPGLMPNYNSYPYPHPLPRCPGIQVQPVPPPIVSDQVPTSHASMGPTPY